MVDTDKVAHLTRDESRNNRRNFLKAVGATSLAGIAGCTGILDDDDDEDEQFPEEGRELEFVIPRSAGGGFDFYVRTISPYLEEQLEPTPEVVPNNVTPGIVATNEVYNADPDGYTIYLLNLASKVWSQIGTPDQAEYDVRDFTFLGQITTARYPIMYNPDTVDPIEDLDDLAAEITDGVVGTTGAGSTPHLFTIIFGQITGAWEADDLDFVHMEGVTDVFAAMDRDEADFVLPAAASGIEWYEDGVADVALLVAEETDPLLGDPPTPADWNLDEANELVETITAPWVWVAPPDLAEDRQEILSEALEAAAEDPGFEEEAEEAGRPIIQSPPETVAASAETMYEVWSEEEDLLEDLLG